MNHQRTCRTWRSPPLRWGLTGLGAAAIAIAPIIATATPKAQLDTQTRQVMMDAIHDEYRARAFYSAVIAKFGNVRPFSNIVYAEDRHVLLWKALFTQYGLPIPADPFAGNVTVPDTLETACQAGVEAEIANVAMYDRFLGFVQQPDLRAAFTQLRQVSQERHLPAFQRCANR